jgi:uncharacterized protein
VEAGRSALGTADRLVPVGYQGRVRLAGALGERLDDAADFYSELPIDDVLHGFRERAGLPSRGSAMAGWADSTSEMTFGQWVSGLARMSAVLGRPELAERAADLLDGYLATLGPRFRTGMTLYSWEKLVCGIVDAAVYCGHRPPLDLLPDLVAHHPELDGVQDATPARFMGSSSPASTEWYTVAENLHRGAAALEDPGLHDEARQFHYPGFWNRFLSGPDEQGRWDVPGYLHAYSHVNTFASAAAAYDAGRSPELLTVLRNAFDWATTTQCFATGGFGPREFTVARDGSLGRSLEWTPDSAEIVCGSWAAFKLSSALLRFTGEARYAEWAESLVYNGIGSCIRPRPDGRSPYYEDYRMGSAAKLPYPDAWPCCSGSYAQAVPHIADLIYFTASGEISVAMYLPSSVTLESPVRAVITQRTSVPQTDDAEFEISLDRPREFSLRLRLPSWSRDTRFFVDGTPTEPDVVEQGWAVIRRSWRDGSRVRVTFDPLLRAEAVDPFHPDRAAILVGPVVLAQEVMDAWPFTLPGPWPLLDLDDHLRREDERLAYRPVAPGSQRMHAGLFRPLADYPERKPYRVYHDLDRLRLI